ncbi:hypothetical protein Vafri_14931 [Volvox africanus]|uniref:Uncharacterized protein n=2 Tax=Volvox africanus TaxID=51714 RepID=A0A8J4BFP4_9CHLO|nr:hypothetical protein Vafri_14931 [Volvox africanus]
MLLPFRRPPLQEFLGGPEVSSRAHILIFILNQVNKNLQKILCMHVQALVQQQNGGAPGGGGGPGGAPGGAPGQSSGVLVPGAPVVPLTAADLETATKGGELPRVFMQRTLPGIFPGPFHLHYCRCKGLITPSLLAQCFRSEELAKLSPHFAMSRETLLERYRALGLQAQLLDPRQAPHAAARKMWMSFRGPAPPPELHSHILDQQVSSRQRQRWRRQRGAALALGSSAPLWTNAQVDCLTSVPIPPGTSWSLEGAAAVGAVTAQMGPGVGAAASRSNLPPLLAAVQRAWVCCAPPAELGSQWKRARLGLEQDLEY